MRRVLDLLENADAEAGPHPRDDDAAGIWKQGYCHLLAMAVRELCGEPIVALVVHQGRRRFIAHVMNLVSDGEYLDIEGVRNLSEILDETEFESGEDDYEVVQMTAAQLRSSRRLARATPEMLKRAREVAARLLDAEFEDWRPSAQRDPARA